MISDDAFVQALEGDEAVVRDLYETISHDERHESVSVLEEQTVPKRVFARWAMAKVAADGGPDICLLSNASRGTIVSAPGDPTITAEQEAVLAVMRDRWPATLPDTIRPHAAGPPVRGRHGAHGQSLRTTVRVMAATCAIDRRRSGARSSADRSRAVTSVALYPRTATRYPPPRPIASPVLTGIPAHSPRRLRCRPPSVTPLVARTDGARSVWALVRP